MSRSLMDVASRSTSLTPAVEEVVEEEEDTVVVEEEDTEEEEGATKEEEEGIRVEVTRAEEAPVATVAEDTPVVEATRAVVEATLAAVEVDMEEAKEHTNRVAHDKTIRGLRHVFHPLGSIAAISLVHVLEIFVLITVCTSCTSMLRIQVCPTLHYQKPMANR